MDLVIPNIFFETAYDAITVPPLATVAAFEEQEGTSSEPFTAMTEGPLVEWLFATHEGASAVSYSVELQRPARVATMVRRHDINEALEEGDFDVIAAPVNEPGLAVAIECKRVKATFHSDARGVVVNKLPDLNHGIHQANLALAAGFSRACLLIVAQVDARSRTDVGLFHRGLRRDNHRAVLRYPRWDKLNAGVGIAYIEIVQVVDRPIEVTGVVLSTAVRSAIRAPQSADLTAKVANLLASSRTLN